MAKISLDKYYTSQGLAKYCIDKTYEIIGEHNISEVIEPSAGNGSFSLQMDCWSYDIEPEHPSITQQDFLTLDAQYLYGRLIIGNPPFGARNQMSTKFFKKAVELGDYIAFILPIGQLRNTQTLYEFDLVYSEDLGETIYSDVKLHCCFNIYRRPSNGTLNKPKKYTLDSVKVLQFRRGINNDIPLNYDFGMCTWGNGSCGKPVDFPGQYAQEHYIYVKDEQWKTEVLRVCKETDWRNLYPSVSSAKLQTWKIYKHIQDSIEGIT